MGEYSLVLAVLASVVGVMASAGALRLGTPVWHRAVRWSLYLFAASLALASGQLLWALAQSDFSIGYVASYTERALPMGYKLSAFWAGQEGSLLFWALVLSGMVCIFAASRRQDRSQSQAATLLTLAIISLFFSLLLLYAASPFSPSKSPVSDGHGLNPMLQNIGMIAHPPTLFVGYAGFAIPFALMVGALVTRQVGNEWVFQARRWVLVSWLFLTVGIVLGCQWAYVELGWGGYWAWDPVENASLLPWLTGTALLHGVIVQQQRGMLRISNALLAAASFLLCIFGTYLTRSGIIESVHAFQTSLISTFFFYFLLAGLVLSVALILWRLRDLRQQPPLEAFTSKEGAIFIGNILLVIIMGLTLLGTIFPLLSELATGQTRSVNQSFYNTATLPVALVLIAIMALAPALSYGITRMREVMRCLVPAIAAVLGAVAIGLLGFASPWALASAFVVTLTLVMLAMDLLGSLRARMQTQPTNPPLAAWRLIDGNHRRYGGHLAHMGIVLIVSGITGSSLYATKGSFQLKPGESAELGGYTLALEAITPIEQANFEGLQAQLVVRGADRSTMVLRPELRHYYKATQNNAEVAFHSTLLADFYVTLNGVERNNTAGLQVVINPLVIWIWIGGIMMTLGGIWSLLPTLIRRPATVAAADQAFSPPLVQGMHP